MELDLLGNEIYTASENRERLKATTAWALFTDRFDMSDARNVTLLNWLFEDLLEEESQLIDYEKLLQNIVAAGGVVKVRGERYEFEVVPTIEPVIEPEVPKDKNGNVLSESQIAWGEMTRWSQTASSRQIEDRRRIDPAFESFYKTNLRRAAKG